MKIFDDSTADELLIEEEGLKIRIRINDKNLNDIPAPQMQYPVATVQPTAPVLAAPEPNINHESTTPEPAGSTTDNHELKSPIVGTFYRAPSPDSEPFVEIGSHIAKGDTLCIVEAMKLMNEIESDISGTIVKINLENAAPVEYGQVLFEIKPD